jgi:hypothetical protein
MKKFIAFFDYLGFKDFIERNEIESQHRIMNSILVDIEMALGQGKTKPDSRGVISDIDDSIIKCINFSDTVVFWTNDDTDDSLHEVLAVAYKFNFSSICFTFPVRGSIVYGDITHIDFKQSNNRGGLYNINSLYGKGLVAAYLKAENQDWAGTVIDQTLVDKIALTGQDPSSVLNKYAKRYKVPYKKEMENQNAEFVLRLTEGSLNTESFENVSEDIKRNFGEYNKSIDSTQVQKKLSNTIEFLKSFLNE